MTNQEINEAVAKKLGLRCCPWKVCECKPEWPEFATSISAAWKIVEHLTTTAVSDGLHYSVSLYCTDCDPKLWHFDIGHLDSPMMDLPKSVANTAPMAICKAFLELKQ